MEQELGGWTSHCSCVVSPLSFSEAPMADDPVPASAGSPGAGAPLPETVDLQPAPNLEQAPTLTLEDFAKPSGAPSASTPGAVAQMQRFLGEYELLGEIGRGGMGVVYRARERHSGRLVAVKMMLRESADSHTNVRRFMLEARATGELNHPGI